MLYYTCVDDAALDEIRRHGLRAEEGGRLVLSADLDAARGGGGAVLAVQLPAADGGEIAPSYVPPAAIRNLNPYLPPRAITAAGGYVMRPGGEEPELLVIFRKGVWDLPKGKLDDGESIEACAVREVQEEVGIERLTVRAPLGATVHAYPDGPHFSVKTTHWYLMETPERTFSPQAEEQIEAVTWMPWSRAFASIGYEAYRRHMERIRDRVFSAFARSRPG